MKRKQKRISELKNTIQHLDLENHENKSAAS